MDQNATGMGEHAMRGPAETPCEPASEFVPAQAGYGLMDVLFPVTPPQPRNARIVRLFDLEAAKYDPRPETPQDALGVAAAPAPGASQATAAGPKEPRTRSASREERRSSLAAAAGLF
jgi:hypothetical protein